MELVDLKRQQERISPDLNRRIARVLEHAQYIMGPEVSELEEKLCQLTGAKYCVTCSSGTDALLLPLMAYELKQNDVVFVPSFTFAATAEAVVLAGGKPFFVDVDEKSFNICPESLSLGIAEAKKQGYNIRGVIVVGLFGNPPPFDEIKPICEKNSLFLIDDAAQSLGSSYKGQMTGSIADVTATSFFPAKPLGCYGDGGAIFTNREDYAEKLQSLRVHGKGKDKYTNVRVGLNARLDTLQAAILLSKLVVFESEVLQRAHISEIYNLRLAEFCAIPVIDDQVSSAWAAYTIRVSDREKLLLGLERRGIPSQVYYPNPLYKLNAYCDYPRVSNSLDRSETAAHEVLSLPVHAYLSEREIDSIVAAVKYSLPMDSQC
jgi:UDP-2-acetamido-2-deoxy-ribo-hexuluronate aminotransferase